MQVAQGQGLVRDCALVHAAMGCCILLYTLYTMHVWKHTPAHTRTHTHTEFAKFCRCTKFVATAKYSLLYLYNFMTVNYRILPKSRHIYII